MWRLVSEKYGDEAQPSFSHHISDPTDASRFAEWVVQNDDHHAKIKLFMYLPKNIAKCERIVFSIHGRERNARKYRNIFVNSFQDKNILLVAPRFKGGLFNRATALTLGNMYTGTGAREQLPKDLWTFTMLEEIFELLQDKFTALHSYDVFGHSAGGQFAYRLALFADSAFRRKVVAANPGWLTAIDSHIDYPYGIKNVFSESQIRNVLAEPLVIIAGESDIDSKALRMSKKAREQGSTRFERAMFVFNGARSVAQKNKIPFHWQLKTVPKMEHSAKSAALAALPFLLH